MGPVVGFPRGRSAAGVMLGEGFGGTLRIEGVGSEGFGGSVARRGGGGTDGATDGVFGGGGNDGLVLTIVRSRSTTGAFERDEIGAAASAEAVVTSVGLDSGGAEMPTSVRDIGGGVSRATRGVAAEP